MKLKKKLQDLFQKRLNKLVQPYQKKEETQEKLSDRVVALVDDNK